jgi:glycine betaine/choline ABC-type transport system substrate-binding protein
VSGGLRAVLTLGLVLGPAIGSGSCSEGAPTIVIGSKNFSEQDILGELVAQWIERTTDIRVQRTLHLGGTFVCHRALTNGELDLYVEYTGTAWVAILEQPVEADPRRVYDGTQAAYQERFGLTLAPPLGFENTFAILVRRSTADSLGLSTISDAVPHASEWVPGFGYEFTEREDGWAGLAEAYGFERATVPKEMDLGLTYRALADGQVDFIAGNSTDGLIVALDLVMLDDDRKYFPPYEAVPVVRAESLQRHPGLGPSLARLAGRIDTESMRTLNRAVDVERRDYVTVVREWVDAACEEPGAGCTR